mmetsp:Transcript_27580/g.41550  ORF Transcript_27580/g.41550 Transcript_27580/m.41550 type:complete len:100 (+) Transcript_27580:258-557(+)
MLYHRNHTNISAAESKKGMDDVDNTRTLSDAISSGRLILACHQPRDAHLMEVWTKVVHIRVVFNQSMKKSGARKMTRERLLVLPRPVIKLTKSMRVVDR